MVEDPNAAGSVVDALGESEARKAAILESALDCIVSMDHQGRITEFNPAAERTFGYRREEVIGKPLAEVLVPEPLREAHRRGLARYLATGDGPVIGKRIEIAGLRKDGTEIPIELAITRVHVGGPPAFTGYIRDISQRKAAEIEKAKLFERAQREVRVREDLMAVVSHDLRSPLASILLAVDLINRQAPAGSEGDRVRAHAAKITQYCERMNRLIADLLDYATIHTGRFTIVRKAERTLEVIDEAIDICQHQAQGRSIRFEKQVPSDCERLHCDRGRLVQVFANLLGNAVKFSPNEALVRIAAQTSDAAIQFSIEDHGAGIAPEHLALVFEPYWKGAHKEGGGTGLGLFIVRGIIEAHQGRIWVESSLGRGTTFFFTVPREPSG